MKFIKAEFTGELKDEMRFTFKHRIWWFPWAHRTVTYRGVGAMVTRGTVTRRNSEGFRREVPTYSSECLFTREYDQKTVIHSPCSWYGSMDETLNTIWHREMDKLKYAEEIRPKRPKELDLDQGGKA